MGLSRTVSEINGDFNPRVFLPPLTELPLELGMGAWSQTSRTMGLSEG